MSKMIMTKQGYMSREEANIIGRLDNQERRRKRDEYRGKRDSRRRQAGTRKHRQSDHES